MACLSRYAVAPNLDLVALLQYLHLMQLAVDGKQESTHAVYVHEHSFGNLPSAICAWGYVGSSAMRTEPAASATSSCDYQRLLS